jgi:hypothetical protein
MTNCLATETPWLQAAECSEVIIREAIEAATFQVFWHRATCTKATFLRLP